MKKLNEIFLSIADKVSYGMGTPQNIIIWFLAVALWIAFGPVIATHNFMPDWFTSNSFNFPLNTITTLAELFIGFLVAASANRSERNDQRMMEELRKLVRQAIKEDKKIEKEIESGSN